MPSYQAQYDPVSDDGYESKACFSEEDFKTGIEFSAKLIGKLEVPRPNNRSEIVGAMRKIRYEFKARGIEKRRVIISVSVDGLSVILRKRKNKVQWWKENKALLLQHPVHRVFYVSHDSQDLKVFSYIARDMTTNLFMCVVFKAYRHNQAMRIVGTIGQAFEVCHKLNRSGPPDSTPNTPNAVGSKGDSGDSETYRFNSTESEPGYIAPVVSAIESQANQTASLTSAAASSSLKVIEESSTTDPDTLTEAKTEQTSLSKVRSSSREEAYRGASRKRKTAAEDPTPMREFRDGETIDGEMNTTPFTPYKKRASTPSHSMLKSPPTFPQLSGTMPLSYHHLQLMRQQLEQHNQQAQVAMAQVHLMKDKLTTETAARVEAQARVHQLLLHNRELLDHLNQLVNRVHLLESGRETPTTTLAASLTSDSTVQTFPLFSREWPTLSRVFSNNCPRSHDYCTHRIPSDLSSDFSYLLSSRIPPHNAETVESLVDGTTSGSATAGTANCETGGTGEVNGTSNGALGGSGGNISPDSGHKEMSSDSLAQQMYRLAESHGHAGAPDVIEQLPRLDPPPSTRRRPPVPVRGSSEDTDSTAARCTQALER